LNYHPNLGRARRLGKIKANCSILRIYETWSYFSSLYFLSFFFLQNNSVYPYTCPGCHQSMNPALLVCSCGNNVKYECSVCKINIVFSWMITFSLFFSDIQATKFNNILSMWSLWECSFCTTTWLYDLQNWKSECAAQFPRTLISINFKITFIIFVFLQLRRKKGKSQK